MFEDSLVESRGLIISKTRKWTTLGSLALQLAVVGGLIAIPMLRPGILSITSAPPSITIPNLKPADSAQRYTQTATTAIALSIPASDPVVERTQGFIFHEPPADSGEGAWHPDTTAPMHMGEANSLAALAAINASGPRPAVTRGHESLLRVSSGISTGMLLAPITPIYPPIAKAAGIQGPVVIEAVISKEGHVESLNVVSGPAMLRAAAMNAVRSARYAPYRLNGDPVEVQTVITVVFRIGT